MGQPLDNLFCSTKVSSFCFGTPTSGIQKLNYVGIQMTTFWNDLKPKLKPKYTPLRWVYYPVLYPSERGGVYYPVLYPFERGILSCLIQTGREGYKTGFCSIIRFIPLSGQIVLYPSQRGIKQDNIPLSKGYIWRLRGVYYGPLEGYIWSAK